MGLLSCFFSTLISEALCFSIVVASTAFWKSDFCSFSLDLSGLNFESTDCLLSFKLLTTSFRRVGEN